jgi:hypothetical protein
VSPHLSVSTTNTSPNLLGLESGHADGVAGNFYGMSGGVATNVVHVDNHEGNTFVNYYVNDSRPISNRVVNQSFNSAGVTTNQQQQLDSIYDNYAACYNTLFVSGVGNGSSVNAPARPTRSRLNFSPCH